MRRAYMRNWEEFNRETRAWAFTLWCENNRERKRELNRESYHRCKLRLSKNKSKRQVYILFGGIYTYGKCDKNFNL